ncbi:MAG: DUF819 family protein [Oscillospiraceae bacterium]|jgi:uncharacterized membrane protein|nr:DUF819 family protein [Oscillospiraceae bacterium]
MSVAIMLLQAVAIFGVPLALLRFGNTKLIKPIGTVGAAYVLGLAVALLVFLLNRFGAGIALNSDLGEIGSYAAIGIAIPLLLFRSDLKKVRQLSKTVLTSFALLSVSVVAVTAAAYCVYGKTIANGGVLSAMAAGLYTGGTPNLNAIGNIFHLDATTIGVANLADMLLGGVLYMFLLLAAKPLLKKFLKEPQGARVYMQEGVAATDAELPQSRKQGLMAFLVALGMAAFGGGVGAAVWLATGAQQGRLTDYLVPSVMITTTVLGIAGSFHKKISAVKASASIGQYFILVFSFALAMSVRIEQLGGRFFSILLLYGAITVGTLLLHVVLSKLAKTDVDCTLVTLTAGVYGPAFIPALTRQLKNDALTAPGLICGSVGYAVGTFLGIGLGVLFK